MSVKLSYQSDETLHSFIFRVCLVHGEEEFSEVTNQKFRWRNIINLNEKVVKYFTCYNDHDFLTLLRNSWQASKNTKMFSDPTEYMSAIEYLLSPKLKRKTYPNNPPIAYCLDCIRDSIKENGYGYFKTSWYEMFPDYCATHNKKLTLLTNVCKQKNYELIRTILRGDHPVGCYSIVHSNRTSKQRIPPVYESINESNTLPYDNGSFIYIADCLKQEIKKFILSFPGELPKMVLINNTHKKQMIKNYTQSYLVNDHIMSKIIRCFFQENFAPFMSFWTENAVKTMVHCGVVNINDIFEYIYIFRNTDICHKCNSLTCSIRKTLPFPHNQ